MIKSAANQEIVTINARTAIKLSVLIPSKNRLSLLKHAVSSVLAQPHREIEIVISDNASDDDYKRYVDSLSDARLIYFRQPSSVPVTDNWRKALSLATGDYLLMLGDDDALTPQFSDIVVSHLAGHHPDVAYLAAYHYCYPGVVPGVPAGYFAAVKSEFFRNDPGEFSLVPAYARELAASVLDFRHRFNYNAQHFVLKRSFAEEFGNIGGLYQSPYPDFFAAVGVFLRAKSILVLPRKSVIIGISPKSFGAYYFSQRQKEGYKFLDNERLEPGVREFVSHAAWPGDKNNTNWLVAAEMARRAFGPDDLPQVNVDRYQAIQVLALLREKYWHDQQVDGLLPDLRRRLPPRELVTFDLLLAALDRVARHDKNSILPILQDMEAQLGQYPPGSYEMLDIGPHSDVRDALRFLSTGERAKAGAPDAKVPAVRWGPRRILRGIARRGARTGRALIGRLDTRLRGFAPEAEQSHLLDDGGPKIVVKRNADACLLSPTMFDDFEFRHGDELAVVPARKASGLIRTPEGDLHILARDGRGIRVPPKMEFTPFRGYAMPNHLARLTGAGVETFEELGRSHIANYRKYVGLQAGMSFVEIGSGMGRDAFQLIDVLGASGEYIGIDVQRESIVWCQKNISRDHPNFRFFHFNAHHELHNPLGDKTTLDYSLPAESSSIDRVALQSVLTHIFEDEVVHYLREIARVLKPDGLAYVTFLLYSDEIVAASRRNNLTKYGLRFEHRYADGCYVDNAQYPTGGVAYTDDAMRRMLERAGLRLARPYLKGRWSGYYVEPDDDGQDVAILAPATS